MVESPFLPPERLGLSRGRLGIATDLIAGWAGSGEVAASAITVGRRAGMIEPIVAGRNGPGPDAPAIGRGARFLAASLTKPLTALATMILVERGVLTLDDPVVEHVREFSGEDRAGITIRHLLTHTSGLPDQLPENESLRARHAPLSAFVAAACRTPLLFAPGTAVRYQSMGFAILGEVIRAVAAGPLAEFLRSEVFGPLGMASSSIGWSPDRCDRPTAVMISPESAATDWHWNSDYWLGLGSPWGGLVTSADDYGRFLRAMLGGGDVPILSPLGLRAMLAPAFEGLPAVPNFDRTFRPWGLGWRLRWPGSSSVFGDLLGPRSFGHWGATGTLAWADPDRDAFVAILTTRPPDDRGRHLATLSNVLASAFL